MSVDSSRVGGPEVSQAGVAGGDGRRDAVREFTFRQVAAVQADAVADEPASDSPDSGRDDADPLPAVEPHHFAANCRRASASVACAIQEFIEVAPVCCLARSTRSR